MEKNKILNWLTEEFTCPIRDPIWGDIHFPKEMLLLLEENRFQQLHNIKQLGPTFLVYPGATHTRFNHSLGVFHLARKMLTKLLSYSVPISFPGAKAFLAAALLHDMGHYPYAHALKDLEVARHEKLTANIILADEMSRALEGIGINPRIVAAIIDNEQEVENNKEILFFRNILSGVLDPDKLDYLNRDAYYCGVSYGRQDTDSIIRRILPYKQTGLAIAEQGLASVENLLFSKYLMYKTVYWHKTVRIATAMIKKAIHLGLKAGEITPEDLYDLNDQELASFSRKSSYTPFRLLERVFRRKLYSSVIRIPYDPEKHSHLENPGARALFEKELAREFSHSTGMQVQEEEIILDIPEGISFELDMPVYSKNRPDSYREYTSSSVFDKGVVGSLVTSLRNFTLLIAPESPAFTFLKEKQAIIPDRLKNII